ncbi:MAG: four helix bundle protein [Oscillochloris sp.]|nr:four helix bundle protein [Oscillochloris sp.]
MKVDERMTKDYSYRNLIVWQKAQELAHEVIAVTRKLPQSWANAVIARQIIASATSVGANIAEGHGRYSVGAHRNHLSIAKGSAAESDSWLDLMRREQVLTDEEEARLHKLCVELMKMLTGKIRDLEQLEDQQKAQSQKRETREGSTLYDLNQAPFPFTDADYLS